MHNNSYYCHYNNSKSSDDDDSNTNDEGTYVSSAVDAVNYVINVVEHQRFSMPTHSCGMHEPKFGNSKFEIPK